jgi:hypothetical protein
LLVDDGVRPWYTQKGPYVISALFGMSWYTRMQFMDNTNYAKFTFEKRIDL